MSSRGKATVRRDPEVENKLSALSTNAQYVGRNQRLLKRERHSKISVEGPAKSTFKQLTSQILKLMRQTQENFVPSENSKEVTNTKLRLPAY